MATQEDLDETVKEVEAYDRRALAIKADVRKSPGRRCVARQPGIEVRQIRQVDGSSEFCQEFIDGVEVPAGCVVGEVNGGWAVASRQLFHERSAMAGASPYIRAGHLPPAASTEIARTIISERLLGMPREYAPDRGVPFNQVKRGR
jgi:hypothetical protein